MTRDERKVVRITAAPSLPPEEMARRSEFAEAAQRKADAAQAAEPVRAEDEKFVDELVNMADGLLYTTRKSCEEYLKEAPPELEASMADLEKAMAVRDPSMLQDALQKLEQITLEIFSPDGPGGGSPAQASISRKRA